MYRLLCVCTVVYFVQHRVNLWMFMLKLQSCAPRVRLVLQGKKSSGLTSGSLFPGPASGEEASIPAQFSSCHGSLAWEHGDCGQLLMCLLLPDCLQINIDVCYSNSTFSTKQTSTLMLHRYDLVEDLMRPATEEDGRAIMFLLVCDHFPVLLAK